MPATLADIQKKYGESVYPLYKEQMHEPYMENPSGIGVQGAVLYDELEDKVQCSNCGKWFKWINQLHLNKCGFESIDEYKDTFGISDGIALCSKEMSVDRSLKAKETNLHRQGKKYIKSSKFGMNQWSMSQRSKVVKRSRAKMQFKNKFGLCPAQIESRLLVIVAMCGYGSISEIKTGDIHRNDPKLYGHFKNKYGSVRDFSKELGITQEKVHKYEDADVIAKLRSFVIEHRRIPLSRDMEMGLVPSFDIYKKYFGSWRRAKMMAGLDQLLEEVKNK